MRSKHTKSAIRAVGQRSISSTLLFRPQSPNQIRPGDAKEGAKLGPPPKRVSFSDYLNRKLQTDSVLPRAFQSDRSKAIEGPNQSIRNEQPKRTNAVIESSMFKQFNLDKAGQENEQSNTIHANDDDVVEELSTDNAMQQGRKRRHAFEGDARSSVRSHLLILGDDVSKRKESSANKRSKQLCNEGSTESNQTQHAIKKHVVVLGDDPKPKRGGNKRSSFNSDQPKPQYNHYENGAGWWDYEREGVDNDEVGANEVWEGVGSTTLGEIVDWH